MKLYELADQYRLLREAMDSDNEDTVEAFQVALSQLQDGVETKAESIALLIKELDAEAEGIKAECQRLEGRLRARVNRRDSLKDYLLQELNWAGIEKVKGTLVSVAVRTSPPSCEVVEAESIPIAFRRIIPETWQPDRKAIIDHWKTSAETVPGVQIVADRKFIQVR